MLTKKQLYVQLWVLMLLTSCQTITYTASCRVGDTACQRNQDAQTLAIIGHTDAATELMCNDMAHYANKLPRICTGTSGAR